MRLKIFVAICAVVIPTMAAAGWEVVSGDPSRRIEINRESIRKDGAGKHVVLGRIVLEKPINDIKTSSSYRIIEALNSYDCTGRTVSTIRRTYYKEEGEMLREEEVRSPIEMPVRTGTLEDKVLREVCRPKSPGGARAAASKTVEMVNDAAGDLRKANEALLQQDLKREAKREVKPEVTSETREVASPRKVRSRPVSVHVPAHWSYEGAGGPDNWGRLNADFATCANGKRQSPIDIRDGIRVDLEPIQFDYRPSLFSVLDNGHTVQVKLAGGSISLLGKAYQLIQLHFHRPAEEVVNGKTFDMVAHLVHKAEDGKLAVVAVLLEKGGDNPLIQTIWNNLPLEKNTPVAPPVTTLDIGQLLPENRSYYTYMGSLTTPPCSEDVLWLVLKQPQKMSVEQMMIFARLYSNNARPVQPGSGRLIKESR